MKKLIIIISLFIVACGTAKEIQTTQVQLISWKYYDQKSAWVNVLHKADTITLLYSWHGHSPKFEKGMCLLIKK